MQVDTIRPTLKAPGAKRLKLIYDASLATFAFKFQLRRYNQVERRPQDSKLNFPRAEYDGESEELRRMSHQEMADKLR